MTFFEYATKLLIALVIASVCIKAYLVYLVWAIDRAREKERVAKERLRIADEKVREAKLNLERAQANQPHYEALDVIERARMSSHEHIRSRNHRSPEKGN